MILLHCIPLSAGNNSFYEDGRSYQQRCESVPRSFQSQQQLQQQQQPLPQQQQQQQYATQTVTRQQFFTQDGRQHVISKCSRSFHATIYI